MESFSLRRNFFWGLDLGLSLILVDGFTSLTSLILSELPLLDLPWSLYLDFANLLMALNVLSDQSRFLILRPCDEEQQETSLQSLGQLIELLALRDELLDLL